MYNYVTLLQFLEAFYITSRLYTVLFKNVLISTIHLQHLNLDSYV